MKNTQIIILVMLVGFLVIGHVSCSDSGQTYSEGIEKQELEWDILFRLDRGNRINIYRLSTIGEYPDSVIVFEGDAIMPIWSPDRSQFVFSYFRNDHFDIALARPDGSDLQFLTADTNDNMAIASFFPDGDSVVFSTNRDGNLNIYCIRTNGTGLRPVFQNSTNEWHPIVTPDGQKLIFVSDWTYRPRIFIRDLTSRQTDLLIQPDSMTADIEPCISDDGQFLAYTKVTGQGGTENMDIVIFNIAEGTSEQITENPALDRWPRFSPDGKKILFHSNRTGVDALYVYDLQTKKTTTLLVGTVNSSYGDW